jgi:hypothetical protein
MYSEAKKLRIIEEILKIDSDKVLSSLENFLKKSINTNPINENSNFKEFSGIWTKEEADEMERIIEESCENIHPDDWK